MATGDTVLTDDSLLVRPEGLGIALTVPWYRSLWLSSVTSIAVAVAGRPVPTEDLRVELAGQTFTVADLPEQWDTLWFIQDRLVVVVPLDEPVAAGAEVDVEVTVDLRQLAAMGGLTPDDLDRLQQIWATDADINAQHGEFVDYLRSRDIAPESLGSFARLAFNMHGKVDPREWADIMPQIEHVHAKFYDIDEAGNEPAIDYPELVRVFVEGGYSGFFSSEWEGHAFADLGEADPIELVRKQHDLIRRSISAVPAGR